MSFASVLERLSTVQNPFPGLRPFDTEDSHLFFGRDAQISELVALLGEHRFLAVVGVSGCGKSSLVRAGLIPALHRGFVRDGARRWRVATFKPGGSPLTALRNGLLTAGLQPPLTFQTSHGVIDAAGHLTSDESLLLVVDQFEEVFRYRERQVSTDAAAQRARESAEAAEFVELLLTASRHQPPVFVVLTMRSDYIGDCAEFRDLPEALNQCQYLVPRLSRQQRKEVIERPLRDTPISSGLVQRILNDVGDDPEQLPVLQHALMRTWDRWHDDKSAPPAIALEHYKGIGELANALNNHLDELTRDLPDDITATIFKRLTARGRNDRERRDPAPLGTLWDLCGAKTSAEQKKVTDVVDALRTGRATFLTPAPREVKQLVGSTTIDIAHESLIRLWSRLRDTWIPEEQDSAKTFLDLAERAKNWKHRGGEHLWGLDLEDAGKWDRQRNRTTAWAARYVDENVAAQRLREIDELITTSETAERRRARRRALYLPGAITAAIFLAIVAAWFGRTAERANAAVVEKDAALQAQVAAIAEKDAAFREKNFAFEAADRERIKAEDASRRATDLAGQLSGTVEGLQRQRSQTLAAQFLAQAYIASDPEPRLLLALESLVRSQFAENNATGLAAAQAVRNFSMALPSPPVAQYRHRGYATFVSFDSVGRHVVSASDDGMVVISDSRTGREVTAVKHAGEITAVALSPNDRLLLTAAGSIVFLTDAKTGKQLHRYEPSHIINAVAFNGASTLLALGGDELSVYDAATYTEVFKTVDGEPIKSVGFSADGQFMAAGDGSRLRVFRISQNDKPGGAPSFALWHNVPFDAEVVDLAFHEHHLAVASYDDTARVIDLDSKREITKVEHQDDVRAVAFSVSGELVASASNDDTARVFEVAGGKEVARVTHADWVRDVAFGADDRWVITGSDDGVARIVDVRSGRPLASFEHRDYVRSVAVTPDGRFVATASDDGTANVYEIARDVVASWPFAEPGSPILSENGRWLATPLPDSNYQVFDSATGQPLPGAFKAGAAVLMAVSPDGRKVLMTRGGGAIRTSRSGAQQSERRSVSVLEPATGREVKVGEEFERTSVFRAAFTPSGRHIVVVSNSGVQLHQEDGGGPVWSYKTDLSKRLIVSMAVSERFLALGTILDANRSDVPAMKLLILDLTKGTEALNTVVPAPATAMAFNPANQQLLAIGERLAMLLRPTDGSMAPIDVATQAVALRFTSDGRQVALQGSGVVHVFETEPWREAGRITISGEDVTGIRFGDENLIVVTTGSRTVTATRYRLRAADLIADVCSRVRRPLTEDQWKRYVGVDVPYADTCAGVRRRTSR